MPTITEILRDLKKEREHCMDYYQHHKEDYGFHDNLLGIHLQCKEPIEGIEIPESLYQKCEQYLRLYFELEEKITREAYSKELADIFLRGSYDFFDLQPFSKEEISVLESVLAIAFIILGYFLPYFLPKSWGIGLTMYL